jgi:cysteine desulfurase/selenocysteine lyase
MKQFNIPGTVRASLAFYNTTEEIDQFAVALERSILLLS